MIVFVYIFIFFGFTTFRHRFLGCYMVMFHHSRWLIKSPTQVQAGLCISSKITGNSFRIRTSYWITGLYVEYIVYIYILNSHDLKQSWERNFPCWKNMFPWFSGSTYGYGMFSARFPTSKPSSLSWAVRLCIWRKWYQTTMFNPYSLKTEISG